MSVLSNNSRVKVVKEGLESTGQYGTVIGQAEGVDLFGHKKYLVRLDSGAVRIYSRPSLVRSAYQECSAAVSKEATEELARTSIKEGDYVRYTGREQRELLQGTLIVVKREGDYLKVAQVLKDYNKGVIHKDFANLVKENPNPSVGDIVSTVANSYRVIEVLGRDRNKDRYENYVKAVPLWADPLSVGNKLACRNIHVEERVKSRKISTLTEEVNKDELYFLYNPNSPQPPRVRMYSLKEAEGVQEEMCTRNPGEEFFILKAVSAKKLDKVVTTEMKTTF